ncbi:hypothetical protein LIER_08404 [Lithospermum erythrorhizon]|uniref:Uncharacterized protein n=1 Tax=Lithospermum erythrorhizon TaxID=34254 RepID=A0AAV3PGJ2_LITER
MEFPSVALRLDPWIEAASVTPQVAPAGSTPKKKKKKSLVKGVKIPISSEPTPSVHSSGAKSKDKEDTGVTTSLNPAKGWNIFMDGKPGKVAEIRWYALWFFIKGGMEAKVPKKWVDAKRADRPRAEPTDDTFVALAKLKTFFWQKLHWKIFCEEGVMIAANLVPDHEFDTSGNPIPWAPILLAAKDTFLPNSVPLDRMKGKRPIAFKKLKVVKKGVSLPCSSAGMVATQRSSPIAAEPVSSIQPDLQRSSSSPS